MTETKDFSAWKVALGAVGAALGLNALVRGALKLEGTYVTISIACGAALLVYLWIAKAVRRAPTERERVMFLLLYSIFLAVVSFWLVLILAVQNVWHYPGGFVFLLIHYVVYPLCAMWILSKKNIAMTFKNEANSAG